MNYPRLYSFRRCPYAMRARLALYYAKFDVLVYEILLRDKPACFLQDSPKGTVPVLKLSDAHIISESIEIMHYAFDNGTPSSISKRFDDNLQRINDTQFKPLLDGYKYNDRYELTVSDYQAKADAVLLNRLEQRLKHQTHLHDNAPSLTDLAIFPFIRQYAFVDKPWFAQHYPAIQKWLTHWLETEGFVHIMKKMPLQTETRLL